MLECIAPQVFIDEHAANALGAAFIDSNFDRYVQEQILYVDIFPRIDIQDVVSEELVGYFADTVPLVLRAHTEPAYFIQPNVIDSLLPIPCEIVQLFRPVVCIWGPRAVTAATVRAVQTNPEAIKNYRLGVDKILTVLGMARGQTDGYRHARLYSTVDTEFERCRTLLRLYLSTMLFDQGLYKYMRSVVPTSAMLEQMCPTIGAARAMNVGFRIQEQHQRWHLNHPIIHNIEPRIAIQHNNVKQQEDNDYEGEDEDIGKEDEYLSGTDEEKQDSFTPIPHNTANEYVSNIKENSGTVAPIATSIPLTVPAPTVPETSQPIQYPVNSDAEQPIRAAETVRDVAVEQNPFTKEGITNTASTQTEEQEINNGKENEEDNKTQEEEVVRITDPEPPVEIKTAVEDQNPPTEPKNDQTTIPAVITAADGKHAFSEDEEEADDNTDRLDVAKILSGANIVKSL